MKKKVLGIVSAAALLTAVNVSADECAKKAGLNVHLDLGLSFISDEIKAEYDVQDTLNLGDFLNGTKQYGYCTEVSGTGLQGFVINAGDGANQVAAGDAEAAIHLYNVRLLDAFKAVYAGIPLGKIGANVAGLRKGAAGGLPGIEENGTLLVADQEVTKYELKSSEKVNAVGSRYVKRHSSYSARKGNMGGTVALGLTYEFYNRFYATLDLGAHFARKHDRNIQIDEKNYAKLPSGSTTIAAPTDYEFLLGANNIFHNAAAHAAAGDTAAHAAAGGGAAAGAVGDTVRAGLPSVQTVLKGDFGSTPDLAATNVLRYAKNATHVYYDGTANLGMAAARAYANGDVIRTIGNGTLIGVRPKYDTAESGATLEKVLKDTYGSLDLSATEHADTLNSALASDIIFRRKGVSPYAAIAIGFHQDGWRAGARFGVSREKYEIFTKARSNGEITKLKNANNLSFTSPMIGAEISRDIGDYGRVFCKVDYLLGKKKKKANLKNTMLKEVRAESLRVAFGISLNINFLQW